MSEAILQELRFLLVSAAFGIFGGLAYDGLRIFRRLVRHGVWWVALEDLLFCMAASLAVFAMVFMENDGSVRFFFLLRTAAGRGALLYISQQVPGFFCCLADPFSFSLFGVCG